MEIVGNLEARLPELPKFSLESLPNLPNMPSWKAPAIPHIPKILADKAPSTFSLKAAMVPEIKRPSMPNLPSSDSIRSGLSAFQPLATVQNTAQSALDLGIRWIAAGILLVAALAVADNEDMGLVDPYERVRTRALANCLRTSESVNINLQMNLAIHGAAYDEDKKAAADAEDAKVDAAEKEAKDTLPVIHPVVDGRLKQV